jgi:hypothetical protein
MIATREAWLELATAMIRLRWEGMGVTVPADVKLSCSFPGGGSPSMRIGECWPRGRSAANVNEVFINPTLDIAYTVIDVLGHELLHTVDDCKSGHKGAFNANSKLVGYSGGRQSSAETDEAKAMLNEILSNIGAYPHQKLYIKPSRNVTVEPPKDGEVVKPGEEVTGPTKRSAGVLKYTCCNDVLYSTAKLTALHGMPCCRACGGEMVEQARTARKNKATV